MGEKPITKGSSFFIQIFCLSDEVKLGDIYSGGAYHVAEMATDAEVNPLIHRGFIRASESLSPRTCLLWSRKERRDPRHRTDGHTGGTTNADV